MLHVVTFLAVERNVSQKTPDIVAEFHVDMAINFWFS